MKAASGFKVTLPTILFPGGAAEAAGLGLLLAGGWAAAVAGAARLVLLLAPQLPAAEARLKQHKPDKP